MNNADFTKLVDDTFAETRRLLVVKGGEYANGGDRLANFRRGAALTGCTPLQCAFIYASKHFDAIASYVAGDARGKLPVLSEPIEGRLDDLINYCLLMKAIITEKRDLSEELRRSAPPSLSFEDE